MSAGDLIRWTLENRQSEREASFEESTLKLVMAQMGCPRPRLKQLAQDMGDGFGWNWFNSNGWLDFTVGSTRIPEFNFEQLWTKPAGHPVTLAFHEFHDSAPGAAALVFRCFGLGRLVATNVEPGEPKTRIQVPGRPSYGSGYSVLPFADFFTTYQKEPDEF